MGTREERQERRGKEKKSKVKEKKRNGKEIDRIMERKRKEQVRNSSREGK